MTIHARQGDQYELTLEDIAQFAQDGYLVLLDVVNAQELEQPSKPGAEFAMHQDLGYWPKTPNTWTATLSLAISPSDMTNGCLQVISGSNNEPELRSHMPKPFTVSESCMAPPAINQRTGARRTSWLFETLKPLRWNDRQVSPIPTTTR